MGEPNKSWSMSKAWGWSTKLVSLLLTLRDAALRLEEGLHWKYIQIYIMVAVVDLHIIQALSISLGRDLHSLRALALKNYLLYEIYLYAILLSLLYLIPEWQGGVSPQQWNSWADSPPWHAGCWGYGQSWQVLSVQWYVQSPSLKLSADQQLLSLHLSVENAIKFWLDFSTHHVHWLITGK